MASAQVLISEVQPNPATGPEFFELYNTSSASASLANFTVSDQLTTPSVLYTFSADAVISPNQYLLIDLASQKLNNSGDGLTLTNQESQIIDQMQFESSEPGKSWSKKYFDSNVFLLTNPSPGSANLIPIESPPPSPTTIQTTTPYPSGTPAGTPSISALTSPKPPPDFLELSSILPCPNKLESEQIQILNPLTYPVNLVDWYIQDEQNNSSALTPTTISAGEILGFELPKNILNNSGDTAYLYNPNNEMISFISYQSCKPGEAILAYGNSESSQATTSAKLLRSDSPDTNSGQQTATPTATTQKSNKPKITRPPVLISGIKLSDPTPVPTPLAHYFENLPVPPKKHIFSGILGGMLVAGSGVILLPKSKLKNLFNI